ncbi:MAG: class I SAM-dependent methyltransferase [Chloroflexota bacterium]
MTDDTLLQTYNQTPYPSYCYTQTHPDRLATLGTLLGLTPTHVATCRVLELGCASGGNIVPMAYGLPESRFVGIDFAAGQIAVGQQMIDDLGLDNVILQAQDILQLGPELGEFDYIIAHGVYSWTPPAVRDKVLALCRQLLAPNGIAYVSYNTQPGWHMLGALREMMLYRSRQSTDPATRVAQARELLAFLAESVSDEDPYSTFGRTYQQLLQTYRDYVLRDRQQEQGGDQLLLHDELETYNTAVYFHEFIAHAQQHGLQYLVEADFARVMLSNFPRDVQQKLAQLAHDTIELEQYMDFVRNRTFRQTLLCRAEIPLQRRLAADLSPFFIATYAHPETAVHVHDTAVARFQGLDGSVLATDHPVTKAALLHLQEVAPTAVSFPELVSIARRRVYGTNTPENLAQDVAALTANILRAYSYSSRLVELHRHAAPFVVQAGERPFASAVARWQLQQGYQKLTNLRHERVQLDQLGQHLLPYLDGQHDREMLLARLFTLAGQGKLQVTEGETAVADPAAQRRILAEELAASLGWLGRAALLQ